MKIIIPIPSRDFDPTEVAVSWQILHNAGHRVQFATPDGLPGRAMMQYNDHLAWMEGNRVVVMRPDKAPAHGRYDPQRKHLDSVPPPDDAAALEKRALAHSLLPAWLYREQRYRLPETAAK